MPLEICDYPLMRIQEVRDLVAKAVAQEKLGWDSDNLKELTQLVADAETLLDVVGSDPSEPLYLLAAILRDAGKIEREKLDDTPDHIEEETVFEGSLELDGELIIDSHVLVLGDLKANTITLEEAGSLAVVGDVTAACICGEGWFHAPGKTKAGLILGVYEAGAFLCGTVETPLLLTSNHGADVEALEGRQVDLQDADVDDEDYKEVEAILVEAALSDAEENDYGVGRIDFRKLSKLAEGHLAFLR